MDITVIQTSGDVDTWHDVDDALEDEGMLMIVSKLGSSDDPSGRKVILMHTEVDHGPDAPPAQIMTTFVVSAVYAAGMWMKVEFL